MKQDNNNNDQGSTVYNQFSNPDPQSGTYNGNDQQGDQDDDPDGASSEDNTSNESNNPGFGGDVTIVNNSSQPAFIKPEGGAYDGASWVVPAGTTRTIPGGIDGISTSYYNNCVFKVSDSWLGYTIVVNPDGSVNAPKDVSVGWQTFDDIQQGNGGAYPANWENVFKSAETGSFNMTEWYNKPDWWGK